MVEKKDTINYTIPSKSRPSDMIRVKEDLYNNYNDPAIGKIRVAQVIDVDYTNRTAKIYVVADHIEKTVALPGVMTDPDKGTGIWYGLEKGDIVHCHIGHANVYHVTNKVGHSVDRLQEIGISEDGMSSLFFSSDFESQDTDISKLENGCFLIKADNDIKLKLSPSDGAYIGRQRSSSMYLDTSSINGAQGGSSTLESNQSYWFNNSGYSINGVVLRDRRIADIDSANTSNLDERILSRWYKNLTTVNFDPDLKTSEESVSNRKRNPIFSEQRSMVLEFADYGYDNYIQSDEKESKKQNKDNPKTTIDKSTSRRIRKEDVLSLSLVSPNYLIEKVEGTLTDVYGNILDLNRTVLPIGEDEGFTSLDGTAENYYKIRELHRKSVAYHWELNARKNPNELDIESGTGDEYASIERIYKRNRSRMFLDIDKEGQFKLNVPSSTETGNVSVLARYENYSTINPKEKDDGENDYDYFQRSKDVSTDILLDAVSRTNGVINLAGDETRLPKDRTTTETISVGTMFHDISTTCCVPLWVNEFNATGILSGPDTTVSDQTGDRYILAHTEEGSIATKEITVSGENANAGGRSGTAAFDGMLNISIGANTVDRQSLWLDTQGGIVQRVGADLNGISLATQTDGDVYLQIGGEPLQDPDTGEIPDKRFDDAGTIDTSSKTNRFEIRVMQGNGPSYVRILIDNEGVLVCSPKNIEFRAEEDIIFTASGNIFHNAEKIVNYGYTSADDTSRFTRKVRKFEDVFEADPGARPVERSLEYRTG